MDICRLHRRDIRSQAYKKLAKLSVEYESSCASKDFSTLVASTHGPKEASLVALSLREFQVLTALCLAVNESSAVSSQEHAHVLVGKFRLYLLELPRQHFSAAVLAQCTSKSPWHLLGEQLSSALVTLATKFDSSLLETVVSTFHLFLERFFENKNLALSEYYTLLGVLTGLSKHPRIFVLSDDAFSFFLKLDTCIDNFDFLSEVENFATTSHSYPELYRYIDQENAQDLSPILFLEKLGLLLEAIASAAVACPSNVPLLEHVLQKASRDYDDSDGADSLSMVNGNGHARREDHLGDNIVANGTAHSITSSLDDLSLLRSDQSASLMTQRSLAIMSRLCKLAFSKINFLDRGETYIVYSTYLRLKLGYQAKSHYISVLGAGTFSNIIDTESVKRIFHKSASISTVMLDPSLGPIVLQLGSLLTFKDPTLGASVTRSFTSLVANPSFTPQACLGASKGVGIASKVLSQDAVVTTIYALTNLLFVGNDGLQLQVRSRRKSSLRGALTNGHEGLNGHVENGGPIKKLSSNNIITKRASISSSKDHAAFSENEYRKVCENAVTAIAQVVAECDDESVSTLATTILSQKALHLNAVIAPVLLRGLVSTAPYLPEKEFVILVRLLHKLSFEANENNQTELLGIIEKSRCDLATSLDRKHPLYMVYLGEILTTIISKGDVAVLDHHRSHDEISAIGEQISFYLKPLASLMPDVHKGEPPLSNLGSKVTDLFRNIWFNMVVHGYSINSKHGKAHAEDLQRIAYNTPPLASELTWNKTETSLELNTVLKRGSSNHNVKDHRHIVGDVFEISRTMSHSKLMFLAAALFVETLRVKSGDCHTVLKYISDPSMKISGTEKYLGSIAYKINKDFTNLIHCGADKQFSADNIAEQLTSMLALCCYGNEQLQDSAIQCCDLLIKKVPSSLCHHQSLFALLDILTLLYDSVTDSETSQYEPTFIYKSAKTGITLRLPDSYEWRLSTFNRLHDKAQHWLTLLFAKCSFDTKMLIQSYVSDSDKMQNKSVVQFGVIFALERAGSIGALDRELNQLPLLTGFSSLALLPGLVSLLAWRSNFVSDFVHRVHLHSQEAAEASLNNLRKQIKSFKHLILIEKQHIPNQDYLDLMSELAGFLLVQDSNLAELIRYLVEIPFLIFESSVMKSALGIWGAVMKERPNLSILILAEIAKRWDISITMKQGIFSTQHDLKDPEYESMDYSPSNYAFISKVANNVSKTFQPHSEIIKLLHSSFEATLNQSDQLLKLFTKLVVQGLSGLRHGSLHPFARYPRFELIRFSLDVLNYHAKLKSRSTVHLSELIIDSSLSWFKGRASFPFGSNLLKVKADFNLLKEVSEILSRVDTSKNLELTYKKTVLMYFLDDEIYKIGVWLNPTSTVDSRSRLVTSPISGEHITRAYQLEPILAVNLAKRYKVKNLDEILQNLIIKNPLPAVSCPDAVQYFIGINAGSKMPSHHLLFWDPLSPIDAITLFLPPFGKNAYTLQYTMRSLEHHDVNLTFFYVPQIVQLLRYDAKGYVKRFIVETARVSQLFAHQIIWNMLANSYKDEDATDPDSLKPILDDCQKVMLKNLDAEDLQFYETEFGFFNEVTSISGKLKPYIKKSKAEKKVKIDEEMAKIKLKENCYLPSNPDGVLVDINRKSGKPLQSHAKAPFMATFRIKKEVPDVNEYGQTIKVPVEKWQSAIFKVGDDCRQDVLALQLISVFRTIWLNAGLDLYVFPYRVTATAPGCGVIDVLPNSTSRDMLGREAVNGLYQYFITKFGPETSIEFQQARNNLIRSLAAYSIISYLLQFKDRHNGNIMYNDQGHVLHIDFGFCFDIVPGGVKFEAAPFKLTKEMVMVLGGNDQTQAYKWFEELCIKGYLACRPYMETIVRCVNPMLESGLPCFKETTIKKLRKRFSPTKTEREAALYFKGLIKKSYESFYTTGYDEFQRITNGIPY